MTKHIKQPIKRDSNMHARLLKSFHWAVNNDKLVDIIYYGERLKAIGG